MLSSPATVLGFVFAILAITGLAVSPSEAQRVRTSIPCAPILMDGRRCDGGVAVVCRHYAKRGPSGQCIRWSRCVSSMRPC
jgi:hypothetical protein